MQKLTRTQMIFITIFINLPLAVVIFCSIMVANTKDITDEGYIRANKPSIEGIITQVTEKEAFISIDKDMQPDYIFPLNPTCKNSDLNIKEGDLVQVYYDNEVRETYPAQIVKTLLISLVLPAE